MAHATCAEPFEEAVIMLDGIVEIPRSYRVDLERYPQPFENIVDLLDLSRAAASVIAHRLSVN